jgi:hypothetical protein
MKDAWINGIITIASTLIGTFFGVMLPQIIEYFKDRKADRKAKKIAKTRFIFKMLTLSSAMKAIQEEVNDPNGPKQITKIKDLAKVFNVLKKIDLNKEMKELKDLFENSFTPDLKHYELIAKFTGFEFEMNNLISQIGTEDGMQYFSDDIKPILMKLLDSVIQHIKSINEGILSV